MIANLIVKFMVFHDCFSIGHIEPNPAPYEVSEKSSLTLGNVGSGSGRDACP